MYAVLSVSILCTHRNMIRNGNVIMAFNKNTAPGTYSKVKLYVVLYNETVRIDRNALHSRVMELSRPGRNKSTKIPYTF